MARTSNRYGRPCAGCHGFCRNEPDLLRQLHHAYGERRDHVQLDARQPERNFDLRFSDNDDFVHGNRIYGTGMLRLNDDYSNRHSDTDCYGNRRQFDDLCRQLNNTDRLRRYDVHVESGRIVGITGNGFADEHYDVHGDGNYFGMFRHCAGNGDGESFSDGYGNSDQLYDLCGQFHHAERFGRDELHLESRGAERQFRFCFTGGDNNLHCNRNSGRLLFDSTSNHHREPDANCNCHSRQRYDLRRQLNDTHRIGCYYLHLEPWCIIRFSRNRYTSHHNNLYRDRNFFGVLLNGAGYGDGESIPNSNGYGNQLYDLFRQFDYAECFRCDELYLEPRRIERQLRFRFAGSNDDLHGDRNIFRMFFDGAGNHHCKSDADRYRNRRKFHHLQRQLDHTDRFRRCELHLEPGRTERIAGYRFAGNYNDVYRDRNFDGLFFNRAGNSDGEPDADRNGNSDEHDHLFRRPDDVECFRSHNLHLEPGRAERQFRFR